MMSARRLLACVLMVFVGSVSTQADFQVNSYTDDDQWVPRIATNATGGFAVVWQSDGQDGSYNGVYARLFDPLGQAIGDEFQVNTTTAYSQKDPDVAMDAAGNFVVAWSSADDDRWGIWARRYDSSGFPLSGEFQVNTYTARSQLFPRVGMNHAGAFVIAWDSNIQPNPNSHIASWHACGQAYDANAAPVGGEFVVTQLPQGHDPYPMVADSGEFVIGYTRRGDSPNPPLGHYTRMRSYNADGTPKADAVELIDSRPGGFAADGTGSFLVPYPLEGGGTDGKDIYARWFDTTANTIGSPFLVTSYIEVEHRWSSASVAVNEIGQSFISWHSQHEGAGYDLYAQAFEVDGSPLGDEFQIHTFTEGDQKLIEVALNDDGRFGAVWVSEDADGYGVFATFGVIPEPATLLLLSLGGVALLRRRRAVKLLACGALFCLATASAQAADIQSTTIVPSNPTIADVVAAETGVLFSGADYTFSDALCGREGSEILVDLLFEQGIPILPVMYASQASVDVGQLPAGTYDLTVRLFVDPYFHDAPFHDVSTYENPWHPLPDITLMDVETTSFMVVPEPMTIWAFAACGLTLMRRRWRARKV